MAPFERAPARRRSAGLIALALAVAATTTGCSTDFGGGRAGAVPLESQTPSPSAGPAAAPGVLAPSAPVRLRIASIGVDSDLMALGLQDDGSLEVPPEGFPAGWYTGAPTPGELGPAIIAGHVDWDGRPGVFSALGDLTAGDEVTIDRADGGTAVFDVRSVEQFPKDAFPTDAVYADIDHAGLRLITCGGGFDQQAHSYRDNVVVFAELVAEDD